MNFPIVYQAKVKQKKGFILLTLGLAIIFGVLGIKMKADTGKDSGFMLAAIFGGLCLFMFLIGLLQGKAQKNTKYIVDADHFSVFMKGKETRYEYAENTFSGLIQTVNWNKMLVLEIQPINKRKKSLPIYLPEQDFTRLVGDVTGASNAYCNQHFPPQGGMPQTGTVIPPQGAPMPQQGVPMPPQDGNSAPMQNNQ